MTKRAKRRLIFVGAGVLLLVGVVAIQLPSIASGLILHPLRRHVGVAPPDGCREVIFKGEGISLRGWQGGASGVRRGTLIYLHGVADNRASGAGVIERFRMRGFDVVAYDSRAHGDSGGDAATYGFTGAKHNQSLHGTIWEDIERWVETVVGPVPGDPTVAPKQF